MRLLCAANVSCNDRKGSVVIFAIQVISRVTLKMPDYFNRCSQSVLTIVSDGNIKRNESGKWPVSSNSSMNRFIPVIQSGRFYHSSSNGTSGWLRFMSLENFLTTRSSYASLIAVWLCLCAFLLFTVPRTTLSFAGEIAENEIPSQEDEETELEVLPSLRQRLTRRQQLPFESSATFGNHLNCQNCSFGPPVRFPRAIIGHQLANGLCAPLLI